MRYLKTFESMSDLASDSYNKRQERLRILEDMSLELWDVNFNVQIAHLGGGALFVMDDFKGDIIVRIQKRGDNRFNYNDVKDTLLSMISYMESEGYSIRNIDVSDKYVHNLIPVKLKDEKLYLKYRPEQMVNYSIGQLLIKFKE
jgi:hypothetical protein